LLKDKGVSPLGFSTYKSHIIISIYCSVSLNPLIYIRFTNSNSLDASNMSVMIISSTNMRMVINCEYTFILCDTDLRVTNYVHLPYDENTPINKVIILACKGVLPGLILVSYNTRMTFFVLSGIFLRLTQFGDIHTRD
jgi:hypothetical protein